MLCDSLVLELVSREGEAPAEPQTKATPDGAAAQQELRAPLSIRILSGIKTLTSFPLFHARQAIFVGFFYRTICTLLGRADLLKAVPAIGLRWGIVVLIVGVSLFTPRSSFAQQNFVPPAPGRLEQPQANPLRPLPDVNRMLSPQGLSSTLKLFLVLTVLSFSAVDLYYDDQLCAVCRRVWIVAAGTGHAANAAEPGDCLAVSVFDVFRDVPGLEGKLRDRHRPLFAW